MGTRSSPTSPCGAWDIVMDGDYESRSAETGHHGPPSWQDLHGGLQLRLRPATRYTLATPIQSISVNLGATTVRPMQTTPTGTNPSHDFTGWYSDRASTSRRPARPRPSVVPGARQHADPAVRGDQRGDLHAGRGAGAGDLGHDAGRRRRHGRHGSPPADRRARDLISISIREAKEGGGLRSVPFFDVRELKNIRPRRSGLK